MQIDSFLEKRERTIYQLILYLEDHQGRALLKEVCQRLGLSKPTLLRYIETFNEEADAVSLGLRFQLREETLDLKRKNNLSSQVILAYLCQNSIKCQIITYLSDKEEVSLQALSQVLLISEATLNRHLASLNRILSSAAIRIKNGSIKGDELQVRYFLHQFFSLTVPDVSWQEKGTFRYLEALLPIFERFYHSKLNPKQSQRLLLWLMISQQRSNLHHLDFETTVHLMRAYRQHKFYKRLYKLYGNLFKQELPSNQEEEMMCLFAFVFSQFLLESRQLEQFLAFGGPIMEATSLALNDFLAYFEHTLPVSEEAMYCLSQIMGQLYFFQGVIEVEAGKEIAFKQESEALLEKVYHQVFGRRMDAKQIVAPYRSQVAALYLYFSQVKPIQVKIGFASSWHEVLAYPLFRELKESLEGIYQAVVLPYQAGASYDLLVTDYLDLADCPIYYLGHGLKSYDIVQLKVLIRQLYRQKSQLSEHRSSPLSFSIEHR